jgi:outer membrane protein assembly factor BamA
MIRTDHLLYKKQFLLVTLGILFFCNLQAQPSYHLNIVQVDKTDSVGFKSIGVKNVFDDEINCFKYIGGLSNGLYGKGFLTASIDSLATDSLETTIWLFLGKQYKWASLQNGNVSPNILEASGYNEKYFQHKILSYQQVAALINRVLDFCENNGYPFARVHLDSVHIRDGTVSAKIFLDQGFVFKIDSISQQGSAKIAGSYLQHYLGIRQGSLYDESKLQNINSDIASLSFLQQGQPWNIDFLGDQTRLNLYLDPKKSNQFDFLVGFLPNNAQTGKLLVTGQATLHLVNSFSHGEDIDVNWQQLQYQSPQLHLAFQYPYLFNSSFGLDLEFNLFRKDSSYLNLDEIAGFQYQISATDYFKVYVQNHRSVLLTVDTTTIKLTHQLPANIDESQTFAGFDYSIDRTNYRLNPRKGYQLYLSVSGGVKKIIENNTILQLQNTDTLFNYASLYDSIPLRSYQTKLLLNVAKYFPIGRAAAVKTAFSGGAIISQDIFLNELFQIGGYELLRGFDEQSIYASQYAVLTLEYHYLLAQNSYFYFFSDDAFVNEKYQYGDTHDFPMGLGIGLAFQTKAGIFNVSWAVGRRNDTPFNLRLSKIHFGYLNYF